MSKYYTGVGSRETPENIIEVMSEIAFKLSQSDWILRSGGAEGADNAFEDGAWNSFSAVVPDIYLPWNGFNDRYVTDGYIDSKRILNFKEAQKIASTIHPAWDRLSNGAKTLHGRNVYQVLGKDLNTPSKFLICWAKTDKHGEPTGGTRTAWKLAEGHGIPCFNLILDEDYDRIYTWINK